ncbi:SNF2 helicase associated domain protein [Paenibacillus curdlanolyticus YK9]|uniref:SNF2 helicase associated domain protein n=1 Tax=Paenibacillus curdlanolyticus YK9 TaxID=717606 RepID=E0IA24_9BACL|nr:DEAD/DEAH box helicase [Paenibacillus curdlanolyticus]EFM10601.1 SNF2 helicase associated domain protein [Paenibacillus curdlanolyticus YK9]
MKKLELTQSAIKRLCGSLSYNKGETLRRGGKVSFTHVDAKRPLYEATVAAAEPFHVAVTLDQADEVAARCSCPSLSSYDSYCSHIAAVLLEVMLHEADATAGAPGRQAPIRVERQEEAGQAKATPRLDSLARAEANDLRLTSQMLALFGGKPKRPSGTRTAFDTREPLEASFALIPFRYRADALMFGIELKVGPQPKRLYIVQKLHEFLDAVQRRESYRFSKHFTYEPEQHRFPVEQDQVIQALIRMSQGEQLYLSSQQSYAVAAHSAGDRMLLIPPEAWEAFAPLLEQLPSVQLQQQYGSIYEGAIRLADEPLPLQFHFEPVDGSVDSCRLRVDGLESMLLMEAYGVAIAPDGKLLQIAAAQAKQLAEVQSLLQQTREQQFIISPEQMELFMERVVPGLMKLGRVQITKEVSERVVQAPLKAKLYLDRVRDRLLAALEFHYGDIVIHPLDGAGARSGADRILVRDGDREEQILALMAQADSMQTEGGYLLSGDDAEYDFLYHLVPKLEKLLDVYATSAVKTRMVGAITPTVKADVDERTDWLEFRFEIDGIPEKEIKRVLQAVEEQRRFYRLPDGALMPLESEEFTEIARLMNDLGVRYSEVRGAGFRVPAIRSLRLMDIDQEARAVKLGRSLRQLLHNMRHPDSLNFDVPEPLVPVLRDYQTLGYQWMKTLAYYQFGGILADDMGLGKTVQSIAFLVSVLPEIRAQGLRALIVCPASLIYNWQHELQRFAPEIRAAIAAGDPAEREKLLTSPDVDIIITSYPLLRRDIKLYMAHAFHTLILDEAQYFKNYATQTAQAAKAIQAKHRFALTGTPVENRLEELWSIYSVVFPELFPSRQSFYELTRETVARRARPFLLRRLKKDVLKELPDKIETLQSSELLPEQKKLYTAYLAKLRQETLKHLDEDDFGRQRIKILAGITRLRQICCHPGLFVEDYRGGSAKLEQLLDIVEDCRGAGKRMLLFSQFTGMLGIIREELGVRGVPLFYLDGSTPPEERAELCQRFNAGEKEVFLISLKAGGTGLNLTGADTVIMYDMWWNPAVEQQAADRAHRIGQKNVVQVIRLVAQGTVEDKMHALQERKKQLIDEVIQPGGEPLGTLTEADIRDVLQL